MQKERLHRSGEPNQNYTQLMSAVREAAGDWMAVPLVEIGGANQKVKQSVIIQAAIKRGLRVQTSIQGEELFVRLVVAR